VLELTGDTSFDASLQTVAKASIILTTVRWYPSNTRIKLTKH